MLQSKILRPLPVAFKKSQQRKIINKRVNSFFLPSDYALIIPPKPQLTYVVDRIKKSSDMDYVKDAPPLKDVPSYFSNDNYNKSTNKEAIEVKPSIGFDLSDGSI